MFTIDTSVPDSSVHHMTTLSINHEAAIDLDSTNAFEGKSLPKMAKWHIALLSY